MVSGNNLVISLNAELDHHLADEMREVIDDIIDKRGVDRVIIDFSKVDFMDSAGIGLIMGRYKKIRDIGDICVVGINESIKRILLISGLITATCFSVTFAMSGHFIVHIFTDDAQMINLVVRLLIVDIFLEFGRVTNLVYGQALKTSGDAVFPVIMGAIFMYLFAVGGTYFLGIHMGLQAVGAYIAMAGDECARAVGMVLRWKSGKWKSKSLVEL